jgi:hypothetical protein
MLYCGHFFCTSIDMKMLFVPDCGGEEESEGREYYKVFVQLLVCFVRRNVDY